MEWMQGTFSDLFGKNGERLSGGERTYRKILWNENGDWLPDIEYATALKRLLCR